MILINQNFNHFNIIYPKNIDNRDLNETKENFNSFYNKQYLNNSKINNLNITSNLDKKKLLNDKKNLLKIQMII